VFFCCLFNLCGWKRYENNANLAQREIAFVALLAQALTQRGLIDVEVTGFRGEVLTRLGRSPTNAGPYRGLKMYVTSGMLAESMCTKVKRESSNCIVKQNRSDLLFCLGSHERSAC
jgi:hypothetical protein